MSLDHDTGILLASGGSFFEDDDIAGFVLNIAQSVRSGKGGHIITDGPGVAGTVGNRTKFFKIIQIIHIDIRPFCSCR